MFFRISTTTRSYLSSGLSASTTRGLEVSLSPAISSISSRPLAWIQSCRSPRARIVTSLPALSKRCAYRHPNGPAPKTKVLMNLSNLAHLQPERFPYRGIHFIKSTRYRCMQNISNPDELAFIRRFGTIKRISKGVVCTLTDYNGSSAHLVR